MYGATKNLLKNNTGNVAIITALTLAAVIGLCGAAYDLASYSENQARYSAAADAAALAAVSFANEKTSEGSLSESAIKTAAVAYARSAWEANLASEAKIAETPATIVMTNSGTGWSSRITYTAKFPTHFLAVVGVGALNFNGAVKASSDLDQSKWEFNFLIDTSSSMGLGATSTEMTQMLNHPKINCEFACHRDFYSGVNTIDVAHAAGIRLRVDVVDSAVDSVIDELEDKEGESLFKASLYGMADSLKELVPLNANLSKVKNHVIKLAEATASQGNTDYRVGLSKITQKITGNSSNAHKVLFIVTDGVHDMPHWDSNVETVYSSNHQLGPIDPNWCSTLKTAGVQVGVLHVDYKVPSRSPFPQFVEDYDQDIVPTLKACASKDMFFSADTPQGITDGLKAMLDKALEANVRLTE
jgi:Flp pilus assembly protein TadG